jgi:hypothetical protein
MEEDELDVTPPYPDIAVVKVEIEDVTDKEFVDRWANTNLWGTPLYHEDTLHRWPERHAAVITAIAQAQPGGILFHCVRGYDRTGIISLLLLAIAGVTAEDITADYELSVDDVRDKLLNERNTSSLEVFRNTLNNIDIEGYLLDSGVSQVEIDKVKERLLGSE